MKPYIVLAATALILSCQNNSGDSKSLKDSVQVTKPSTNDTLAMKTPETDAAADLNSFGPLALDMKADTVIAILGKPTKTEHADIWEADGLMHEDWEYPAKGIVLNMSYAPKQSNAPKTVYSISGEGTCVYKTKAGVGIGSTAEEVKTIYNSQLDPMSDSAQIVVGSVYGGLGFEIEKGKVKSVFVGAAAE